MKSGLRFIYQHPLISEQDLEEIAAFHHPVDFGKNEFLLKDGQTADSYYILNEGLVRAFVHDYDNTEITTEFFVGNDIVIVPSSLFQKNPSMENLQAVTDCSLLEIKYDDFQTLFHKIEGMREWGRMWFTYQLFAVKQRSLDMVMESATERYRKLMQEKPQILLNAPLKQIASYLGITDSSLSRIRREI